MLPPPAAGPRPAPPPVLSTLFPIRSVASDQRARFVASLLAYVAAATSAQLIAEIMQDAALGETQSKKLLQAMRRERLVKAERLGDSRSPLVYVLTEKGWALVPAEWQDARATTARLLRQSARERLLQRAAVLLTRRREGWALVPEWVHAEARWKLLVRSLLVWTRGPLDSLSNRLLVRFLFARDLGGIRAPSFPFELLWRLGGPPQLTRPNVRVLVEGARTDAARDAHLARLPLTETCLGRVLDLEWVRRTDRSGQPLESAGEIEAAARRWRRFPNGSVPEQSIRVWLVAPFSQTPAAPSPVWAIYVPDRYEARQAKAAVPYAPAFADPVRGL